MEVIQGWLTLYGLKVAGALAILVLGLWAAKFMTKAIQKAMKKGNMDQTLVSFGGKLTKFFLIVIVIMAALNQLGFETTSLIAVLGAASLAVGLALQSNLSSLAAGIMILIFRPFNLGQVIETNGMVGTVESIGIMQTILKCADGRTVILPNTKVFGDRLINYSVRDVMRADLVVGIGYDDDIEKAKEVLNRLVEGYERAKKDPPPQVFVLELADSSVNLAVRVHVDKDDYWKAKWDLSEMIKLEFDKQGIGIPFPQMDVHMKKEEQAA
ncbi:mechanosensitive ion channel family protein [Dethiosulfatarculus sandiegensis]|uniref:Mechanosensitive ion channel protein n=1 Tax=Dethiosulfatarculus sandiegensis TaxID=1429043 RepID=A0A0D2JAK2_9BACT|nr:mechanosensitive ion channel protein [Dethiosulfatarculus sandiegensis]